MARGEGALLVGSQPYSLTAPPTAACSSQSGDGVFACVGEASAPPKATPVVDQWTDKLGRSFRCWATRCGAGSAIAKLANGSTSDNEERGTPRSVRLGFRVWSFGRAYCIIGFARSSLPVNASMTQAPSGICGGDDRV